MNARWMLCMVAVSCGWQVSTADILDDVGVAAADLVKMEASPAERDGYLLEGFVLSDAHAAEIEAAKTGHPGEFRWSSLEGYHEDRGDYAEALATARGLDKVRLLVRAGRAAEAPAVFTTDEMVTKLSDADDGKAIALLQEACRPLENAGAWDVLGEFLAVVEQKLTSPSWRLALWSEELDVAWHRDQLPKLLEEAARKDPFRLCVMHSLLGNRQESERLAASLAGTADPSRLLEMMEILRGSTVLEAACVDLWKKADLPVPQRQQLWRLLDRMMDPKEFVALFGDWIAQDGDAAPLANLIWERWIVSPPDDLTRKPVVEKLVQRYPDEPRFAILLGRMLVENNPDQALALFEKAARAPLVKVPDLKPHEWRFTDIRSIPREVLGDPFYVAMGCIGSMHRQDRIQLLLAGRKDYGELPDFDRARYLAAGGMDREFVRIIMEADLLKEENDVLAGLLVRVLKDRAESRIIPPEILAGIAREFSGLALGSAKRKDHEVSENARQFFELLAGAKVDPALLKEATARLIEDAGKRSPDLARTVGFWLRSATRGAPEYRDVVPAEEVDSQAKAVERTAGWQEEEKAIKKAAELRQVLELFHVPEIRRLGSGQVGDDRRRLAMGIIPRLGRYPVAGLDRWFKSIPERIPQMNGEMVAQVMRSLGKDHPRRIVAEILIVAGAIDCRDQALKEEAAASVEALTQGTKESRGTELFRIITLGAEGRDPEDMQPVLEDVIKLPPVLQKAFVKGATEGSRQYGIPLAMVYGFIVDPEAAREGRFRDGDDAEARLIALAEKNQVEGEAVLKLAERVLDRQLVAATSQRAMMPPGHDRGIGSVRPMRGADGQPVARIAFGILRKAGRAESWRDGAASKLTILGMPPSGIDRWLDTLENAGDGGELGGPGPKASDFQRGKAQLQGALEAGDAEDILTILGTLSAGRIEIVSDPAYLEVLGTPRAGALLQAVTSEPIIGQGPKPEQVGLLHLYFLNADPGLAAAFRDWLATQKKRQFVKESAWPMADQLARADATREAVDLIAKSFVVPTERSDEPWAFPPKKGSKGRPREYRREVTVYEGDIAVLAKWDLLDAAIKQMQELGDVPPLEIATLKMAKDPTAETFETEAVPLLGELDQMIRFNLVSQWETTFKEQANASELRIRLLEERSYRWKNDASSMAFSIREGSEIPGSSAMIARVWQRLLAEIKAGQRQDDATGAARRLVPAMALAADDETWKNYWSWRGSDPEPIGELREIPFQGGMEEAVAPERSKQVMERILEEIHLIGDPDAALGWVTTVLATGDQELVKSVRKKLTGDVPEVAMLCDQAMGRTAGVFPLLSAGRLANGEVGLAWNLVTCDSRQREPEVRDVPLVKIPAMDGKFDLEILAGDAADQLEPLQQIPAAPNCGGIKVKVPEGVKYFALGFTESGTKDSRKTKPFELEENRGLVAFPPEGTLAAKGVARKREAGPGGLPAYEVHLGHHGDVEVASLEWTGGESFQFDAWISGGGELQGEFLDEKGEPIEKRNEGPMDAFRMLWQKRGLKLESSEIPPRTSRVRFSYHGTGPGEGAYHFSVAGARLLQSSAPELPKGFEKIARIPGRPLALALSPDASRLALGMEDGRIVIVDVESGKITGSHVEPSFMAGQAGLAVTDLQWLSNGLHVLDGKGRLRRFDPQTMAVAGIRRFPKSGRGISMHVSRDDKWLVVWSDRQQMLLIPADGGAEREIPLADKIAVLPAPEGIYFGKEAQKWELLKVEDFAQGEPVDAEFPRHYFGQESAPGILDHPKWKDRLQLGVPVAQRLEVDGREIVAIPARRQVMCNPQDGTLYYADPSGTIVRVKP